MLTHRYALFARYYFTVFNIEMNRRAGLFHSHLAIHVPLLNDCHLLAYITRFGVFIHSNYDYVNFTFVNTCTPIAFPQSCHIIVLFASNFAAH